MPPENEEKPTPAEHQPGAATPGEAKPETKPTEAQTGAGGGNQDDNGEVRRLRAEAEAERRKRQEAEADRDRLMKLEEDRKAEELRKNGEFEQLAQQEREKREAAERERDEAKKAATQTAITAEAKLVAADLGLVDMDLVSMVDLSDVPVDAIGKPDTAVIKQRFEAHKAAKPKLYEEPTTPRDRRTSTPPASRDTGPTDWSKKTQEEIKAERDRIVRGEA